MSWYVNSDFDLNNNASAAYYTAMLQYWKKEDKYVAGNQNHSVALTLAA